MVTWTLEDVGAKKDTPGQSAKAGEGQGFIHVFSSPTQLLRKRSVWAAGPKADEYYPPMASFLVVQTGAGLFPARAGDSLFLTTGGTFCMQHRGEQLPACRIGAPCPGLSR